MKLIQTIAPLIAASLLVGCNSGDRSNPPPAPDAPTPPATNRQSLERSQAPAAAARSIAAPLKDQFIATTQSKLKELDTKLEDLAKKAETFQAETKAQADQALADLRQKRSQLNEQLEVLKRASVSTWTDLRAGFEAALEELEKAYEQAKPKFS